MTIQSLYHYSSKTTACACPSYHGGWRLDWWMMMRRRWRRSMDEHLASSKAQHGNSHRALERGFTVGV